MAQPPGPQWQGPPPEQQPYGPYPGGPHPGRKQNWPVIAALAAAAFLAVVVTVVVAVVLLRSSGGDDGPASSGQLSMPIEMRPVSAESPGPCTSGGVPSADGTQCYQLGPGMTVRQVKEIYARFGEAGVPEWTVQLGLEPADAQSFAKLTTTASQQPEGSPGRRIAIVVGGKAVSVPEVSAPITGGQVQITGGFTKQSAEDLVRQITGRR